MKNYITCEMPKKPTSFDIDKFYEDVEYCLSQGYEPIGGLNMHRGVIFQLFSQKEEVKNIRN